MSKKDDLRANMIPPPIKRTRVVNDAEVTKAVSQVVDGSDTTQPSASEEPSSETSATVKTASTRDQQSRKTTSKRKSSPSKQKQGRGAGGKTTSTSTSTSPPVSEKVTQKKEKEPIKRLTIDLPQSLHTRLKIESTQRGISMKDHITELVKKSLK